MKPRLRAPGVPLFVRIATGYGLILLVMLAIAALTLVRLHDAAAVADRLSRDDAPDVQLIDDLRVQIVNEQIALIRLGGTIVINEPYSEGKTSYAAEVDAMIQARPDVIFSEIDPPTAAEFLSEFVKRQPAIPIVGTQPTAQPDWLQAVSHAVGAKTLAGVYAGVQPYAPPQGRPWEIYNDALLAAGAAVTNPGQWSSGPYAIANYDAVTISALAMIEAGTPDPVFYNRFIKNVTDAGADKVLVHSYDEGTQALAGKHAIQYIGPSGAIAFDRWHNVAGGWSVVNYDPSGETKLIGAVDAAAVAKLSD